MSQDVIGSRLSHLVRLAQLDVFDAIHHAFRATDAHAFEDVRKKELALKSLEDVLSKYSDRERVLHRNAITAAVKDMSDDQIVDYLNGMERPLTLRLVNSARSKAHES